MAAALEEAPRRDSIDTIKMFDEFEQEDFDDDDLLDVPNSPPRRSVETLNDSETRRDASAMRQKRQQEKHYRPPISMNEEDSHLITITERTHEDSIMSSQMSGVSMSQ